MRSPMPLRPPRAPGASSPSISAPISSCSNWAAGSGSIRALGHPPLIEVPPAPDLEGARGAIRQVAAAIGERGRGETLIARLDRALAQARGDLLSGSAGSAERGRPAPRILVLRPNGFTVAPRSLEASLLAAAGLENVVPRGGLVRTGTLPLERVVALRPDAILLMDRRPSGGEGRSLARGWLAHPALAALAAPGGREGAVRILREDWDGDWICPGAGLVRVLGRLRVLRGELRE